MVWRLAAHRVLAYCIKLWKIMKATLPAWQKQGKGSSGMARDAIVMSIESEGEAGHFQVNSALGPDGIIGDAGIKTNYVIQDPRQACQLTCCPAKIWCST